MFDKSTNKVLIVGGFLFFALGLLATLGPALPDIARNTHSSVEDAGILFAALFLGAIPAQLVSGWLNDKYGPRPVLAAGLMIMCVGFFVATIAPTLPLSIGSMFIAGLGDGALIVAGNVMIAQTFAARSASALNLMNVFYGIGAIVGPALVGITLGLWQTALPPLWFVSLMMALLLPGVLGLPKKSITSTHPEHHEHAASTAQQRHFLLSPFLWIMSIELLLYVAVEVGMGWWASLYMQKSTAMLPETAAFVASAFYVALTGGRLFGAWLGNRIHGPMLLLYCVTGATVSSLLMLSSVGNVYVTIAAIMLLGLSIGPIYSTIISVVTLRFPAVAGAAASISIAAGSLGGTIGPWLLGRFLEGSGAASYAQTMVVATVTMLVLIGVSTIITRRRVQSVASSR